MNPRRSSVGNLQDWWACLSPHARDELAYDARGTIPDAILPEIRRSGIPLLAETNPHRDRIAYFLSEDVARFVEADNERIVKRLKNYAGLYGRGWTRRRPPPTGQSPVDMIRPKPAPWTADLATARRRGLMERLPPVYMEPVRSDSDALTAKLMSQ
jgi:hypothetical protein